MNKFNKIEFLLLLRTNKDIERICELFYCILSTINLLCYNCDNSLKLSIVGTTFISFLKLLLLKSIVFIFYFVISRKTIMVMIKEIIK